MGADHGTHGRDVPRRQAHRCPYAFVIESQTHDRAEHMPSSHRRYAGWTTERIQRRASLIGPETVALIEIILREKSHPEQGFRATIGILRPANSFGYERLEAAAAARSKSAPAPTVRSNRF